MEGFVLHENIWPWGGWTAKIITPDASGMVMLTFDRANPGVAFLSELTVVPDMRRRGIGTALLEKAIEYCRAQAQFRIDLVTVTKDFVMEFYQKHGFDFAEERDGGIMMYKLLYDYGKTK